MSESERAQAISQTVSAWGCLRFFSSEPGAREAIMQVLDRMVTTIEQLAWLRHTMINKVGEWHGPAELRGVFTSRFPPKDGVEAYCHSIRQFSPSALEMRHHSHHLMLKQSEMKLLPSGEVNKEPSEPRCGVCGVGQMGRYDDREKKLPEPTEEDRREARLFMERIGYLAPGERA